MVRYCFYYNVSGAYWTVIGRVVWYGGRHGRLEDVAYNACCTGPNYAVQSCLLPRPTATLYSSPLVIIMPSLYEILQVSPNATKDESE